jgi:nucleotide-binding universal stress UspA family protein
VKVAVMTQQDRPMRKQILVPLDGSEEAEQVLPYVKTAATGYDPPAKVIVFMAIKVWQEMGPNIGAVLLSRGRAVQTEESGDSPAKQYLKRIVNDLRSEGIDAEEVVIEAIPIQDVAEEILRYAESSKIDLIIVSKHDRSGAKRWAFDSVVDKLVRRSRIPVSVVSPQGDRDIE